MMNKEGLTWEEWAYAAAIPEPIYQQGVGFEGGVVRFSHALRGYRNRFRKERKAWRNGEDPTEWKANTNLARFGG